MNQPLPSHNFKGTRVYVGTDVHKERWAVSLRNAGLDPGTFSMNSSPKELA